MPLVLFFHHQYAEHLHFIQYAPGQAYGSHSDYIPSESEAMHGPRLFTVLIYLNEIEGGVGGETCFPDLDICITPKPGRALLWPQILNEDPYIRDNRTWHAANPISEGYKYASTT